MILIPDNILTQYDAILLKRSVPATCHASYKKWLRYYLDFCGKYMVPDSKSDRVRLFIDKLWDKKQTPEQQKQAAHAVKVGEKGDATHLYHQIWLYTCGDWESVETALLYNKQDGEWK